MSCINFVTFLTQDLCEVWDTTSGVAVAATPALAPGGYTLQVGPQAGNAGLGVGVGALATTGVPAAASVATSFVRFYWQTPAIQNSQNICEACYLSGTTYPVKASVLIDAGGNWAVKDSAGTVTSASSGPSANTTYRVELKVGTGTAAPLELMINGLVVVSNAGANLTTNNTAKFNLGQRGAAFNGTGYYAGFYWDDATYPGDGGARLLIPAAQGYHAGYADPSVVGEVPTDGDISYFVITYMGDIQTYTLTTTGLGTVAALNAVKGLIWARQGNNAANINVWLRSGASDNQGPDMPTAVPYTAYQRLMPANPFTGVGWTAGDVDGMELGVEHDGPDGSDTYISSLYLLFDYPSTSVAAPSGLTATTLADGIRLSWTPVGAAAGYYVERSTDGVAWTQVSSVSHANPSGWDNRALAANTTYYYRVRAYSGAVAGPYSTVVTAQSPVGLPTALFADSFDIPLTPANYIYTEQDATTWNQGGGAYQSTPPYSGEKAALWTGTYTTQIREVLAKMRVDVAWTPGGDNRAGIYPLYDPTAGAGQGCGLVFHDNFGNRACEVINDGSGHGVHVNFPWVQGKWYWFRARRDGISPTLGKIWEDGTDEPAGWLITNGANRTGSTYYAGLHGADQVTFDELLITGPTTTTKAHTTNASLQGTRTRAHGTDSRLKGAPGTLTYGTNSLLATRYVNYNFGPTGGTAGANHTYVDNTVGYTAARGYGWTTYANPSGITRTSGDTIQKQIVYSGRFAFRVDLPNGAYNIQVYTGDMGFPHDVNTALFNGGNSTSFGTVSNQFITIGVPLTITGGNLIVDLNGAGGADVNAVMSALRIGITQRAGVLTHGTDVRIAGGVPVASTRTHGTNTLARASMTRAHGTNARRYRTGTKTYTTDAALRLASVGTRGRSARIGSRGAAFGG